MTEDTYDNWSPSNRYPSDASDQGSCLAVTDPNGVGLYPKTGGIDIVISRGEIQPAPDPRAMLCEPALLLGSASRPTAVLSAPVVLLKSACGSTPVMLSPVVVERSA